MARVVVLNQNYGFGNLSLQGTGLQLEGRGPNVFVAKIGDDRFDFWGSGFTYDEAKIKVFGETIDFGFDFVTGGTINAFTYREDGLPTYTIDGISRSPSALNNINVLTGQNGPLVFNNLLSGDDQFYLANGDDKIVAGGGNDIVFAAGGNDDIQGNDGFDVLYGQDGNDKLNGGYNGDYLSGGNGADTYVITHALDSTIVQADLLLDFTPGLDKIDLSALDPIPGVPGNQAFTFIGSAPITAQGQVQQFGNTLFFDADGDGGFEAIVLPTGVTVSAADFIL